MSKNMKLVGLESYISSTTAGIVVKRGETCRFTDLVAAKVGAGFKKNREGEEVPHWKEVRSDDPITHDFSGEKAEPLSASGVEEAGEEEVAEVAPAARPVAKRGQRAGAAK